MNRLNSKRGFTIVELVVAMAIIVIVSATAVAIVNAQNTVYLRTTQTVEATNMAENAIECFRWAVENPAKNDDVTTAFINAYAKTGIALNNVTDESGNFISGHYTVEKSNMKVIITIEGNKLTFVATDITNDSKVILEKSYTK